MMKFSSGTVKEWSAQMYPQLFRYRHRIFVEKLGWDVPTSDGMEFDQFDREDTVHVVARDGAGDVMAYSRLLPTIKPYLLAEVFPQLMDGHCLPRRCDTWELSRFTAQDPGPVDLIARNFSFSPMAIELLRYSVFAAATQGAKNLIFVGSPGMATLMERADFNVQRMGLPRMINGHRVLAAVIKF
jgi:acyl homoserine lactone synthase